MIVALALGVCLVVGYRVGVGIERARHMLLRAERIPHQEPVTAALKDQDRASVSNPERVRSAEKVRELIEPIEVRGVLVDDSTASRDPFCQKAR